MSQEVNPRRIAPFIQTGPAGRAEPAAKDGPAKASSGSLKPAGKEQGAPLINNPLGNFSEQTGAQFG